jgi:excisionase family DNA binding protein
MDRLLTLQQAAEILGVEYRTVYRLVRRGILPAGRVGRVYRLHERDLEAYFEQSKRTVAEASDRPFAERPGASPETAHTRKDEP